MRIHYQHQDRWTTIATFRGERDGEPVSPICVRVRSLGNGHEVETVWDDLFPRRLRDRRRRYQSSDRAMAEFHRRIGHYVALLGGAATHAWEDDPR